MFARIFRKEFCKLTRGMDTNKFKLKHQKGEENNVEKEYDILKGGTDKFPGSVNFWAAHLKHHLQSGEEGMGSMVFRKALAGLGDSSLPLWKLMLQYYLSTNRTKAEELFKEGILMSSGIANTLKPLYLEWLTLLRGIGAARKTYLAISESVPFCLDMHTKMTELEDLQPVLNFKFTRKCHHLSCLQFGRTNTDVWLSHIKFEETHGNSNNIPDIFNSALKNLEPSLIGIFIKKFQDAKFTSIKCLENTEEQEIKEDSTD